MLFYQDASPAAAEVTNSALAAESDPMPLQRLADSDSDGPRRLVVWAGFIVLLVCFELDQVRGLLSYARFHTDEDQTLLWFAGRELLHLHLHEPNFYGQNYNTVFEALPGGLLHLLGVSLALASPLGGLLMASACWVLLAWAANRRGHQVSAAVALALPVCLSVPYLLLFDAPRGVLSGDLAGAVAVAAAVVMCRPRRRLAVVIAVGGLAIAWDNAVALAVIPALAGSTVAGISSLLKRPGRTLLAAGAALLIPTGWWVLDHFWYQSHPAALTAVNVNTKLQLSVLSTNLTHPGRLFGFYEPQLWQQPGVVIAVIAAVVIAAVVASITFRTPEAGAAALVFLAVLLIILSVRDTLDVHHDLYLSGSRFLLPLPIGLWAVLHFTLSAARQSHRIRRRRRIHPQILITAIVVVTAASMIDAQIHYRAETQAVTTQDAGPHLIIPVVNPETLLANCSALAQIYHQTHAQLLVTDQRNVAYGCAAETGINTIVKVYDHPNQRYDRRGWLLHADATRSVTRILLANQTCRSISDQVGSCRPQTKQAVLMLTPPRPANISLDLAATKSQR